jgi:phospho-N-acetylmuramoyl-pentapeptide-transferase
MLYHLIYPLSQYISGLNVLKYITFRAGAAAVLALIVSFFIGPIIIKKLSQAQYREEIRTDGPPTHLVKAGTPTMGGLIILCAVIFPTLICARWDNLYIWLTLLTLVWMGAVGYIDDYLKVVKRQKKGLIERYKLIGQVTLGLIIGILIVFCANALGEEYVKTLTATSLPFFKNTMLDFGIFYVPLVIFIITATSNSVNLTDGLDGLAIGIVGLISAALALISYITGHIKFAHYLNIVYLEGAGELTIFALALLGASLGFLWFNTHKAQVFMGDIGSLSIGGSLGIIFILIKKELLLPIIGGIFVAESASVLMQRYYFKYTRKKYGEGKRLFKMAPLHHHFEMLGWEENKIVMRFYIIEVLLILISLTTFKIR